MDVCRFSASTNCKSSSSLSSSAECFAPWIVVYLNILSLSFHTQSPICFAFTCLYIFPHNQTYVWLYMIKNKQAHCVAVSSCLCSFPFLFAHRCGEREAVCLIYTSHCSCEAFYRSKYTDTHTYNGHHTHTHTHTSAVSMRARRQAPEEMFLYMCYTHDEQATRFQCYRVTVLNVVAIRLDVFYRYYRYFCECHPRNSE